jgi:hypothetical protein
MYIGDNPTYHHRRIEGINPKESRGILLGEDVSWFEYSIEKSLSKEAIRPCPEIDDRLQLHIFFSVPTDKALPEIERIIGSIRFVNVGIDKQGDSEPSAVRRTAPTPSSLRHWRALGTTESTRSISLITSPGGSVIRIDSPVTPGR